MNERDLQNLIMKLKENESELPFIEVKENLDDLDKIGITISALSNSASFNNEQFAYMIWGLKDKTWEITGTNFNLRLKNKGNQDGILWLTNFLSKKDIFEVFNIDIEDKNIQILRIQNCQNTPVTYNYIAYIRINSHNQKLNKYPEFERAIWNKKYNKDWSAEICKEATFEDLDQLAVSTLRSILVKVKGDEEFETIEIQNLLNRVNLLTNNSINKTCMLFLGKATVSDKYFYDRNKISWLYKDESKDIEERLNLDEIKKPFILLIPEIINQIQRFNTYLRDFDLFRNDVRQYDEKSIEEILINAIAHRDWEIPLWIEVVQTPISLEIRNPGEFKADWEKVLKYNEKPPYQNPNLVNYLNHIKLMEREGNGIRKVYKTQVSKGLQVIKQCVVKDRIDIILTGKVKNIEFAKTVFARSNEIDIEDLQNLEKISNGKNKIGVDIPKDIAEQLKLKDLIDIDWKRKICNFSLTFSQNIRFLGKRRRFQKLTKSQEEAEIMNFLQENKIGTVKEDFMQIFEHKGYTHDMVYNIIRRLKKKEIVRKTSKNNWELNEK